MRRTELIASHATALEVFGTVSVAHIAVEGPEIRPIHPIVVGGRVYWHGATKGEKSTWVGRPAVLSAHEIVAEIPSYFRHPERACPATTYYRSGEIRGTLESVEDPRVKLAVLEALMARFQPEGGHRALSLEDPMYAGAIAGLGVFSVLGEPVGRAKLGQRLSNPDRHAVIEGLWGRGAPGDDRAVESIWRASPEGATLPDLLRGPGGCRLITRVPDRRVDEAVGLVRGEYWNQSWTDAVIAGAMLGSDVWVAAEQDGRLIGTARAMTDGSKLAYIGDVGVHPEFRSRGVGSALLRLLLDHRRVRGVQWASLKTRDAKAFYERLGFEAPPVRPGIVDLARRRSPGLPRITARPLG